MKTSALLCTLAVSALTLWRPTTVEACACCSDPGTYWLRTAKLDDYQIDQLKGVTFKPEATLFMTEALEDGVQGITDVAENYKVSAKLEGKAWVFTFTTFEGKTGTLTLTAPTQLTDFDVDIHDGKKSAGGGPLLYKEWRMEGAVAGTGIFQKGKARYALVLQGRGNRCDNGSDFHHWQLAVTGKNIDFSLHGELVQEAQPEPEPDPAPTPDAPPTKAPEPAAPPVPPVKKEGE